MAEAWHIEPSPFNSRHRTIRDENGLWVAECIAEDAPLLLEAPRTAEQLHGLRLTLERAALALEATLTTDRAPLGLAVTLAMVKAEIIASRE